MKLSELISMESLKRKGMGSAPLRIPDYYHDATVEFLDDDLQGVSNPLLASTYKVTSRDARRELFLPYRNNYVLELIHMDDRTLKYTYNSDATRLIKLEIIRG